LALACVGATGDTQPPRDDTAADSSEAFAEYINVDVDAVGDFEGFVGCADYAGCAWLEQDVDLAFQNEVSMDGQILDFETDDLVPDATLEVWLGDQVVGPADIEMVSDASGNVSGTLTTCLPLAIRVGTDPLLEETKPTYESHSVYDYNTTGSLSGQEFNSVSDVTYRIIPSLLGVSPDPENGIAAGTVYDMSGEKIEGAQVIVKDISTGAIADGVVVKYFVDDFPNRNQPYTSADGLWVAINIPVGSWLVEMWVSDFAGGHVLMGGTVMDVIADSINISSIFTGFGSGVKYPDSCLEGSTDDGGSDDGGGEETGGDESGEETGGSDTGDSGGSDTGDSGGSDSGSGSSDTGSGR
jgi:hypothetical protein